MNKLTFKSTKKSFDELEKEIFQLHNKIRSDPQSYIPKLKEYLDYRDDSFKPQFFFIYSSLILENALVISFSTSAITSASSTAS